MSKKWNRLETWLALFVLAVGGLLMALAGLHTYVTATATRLHPQPNRAPSVSKSTPAPEWSDAVARGRQIVRAALSEQNVPGLSVAVGADGDIAWAEGFGWADIDRHAAVNPDTKFRIGTASTVLTSAAVGLLLERGALELDAEIQTYVPQFPNKEWPVTLRLLMGHLAGVRNDGGDEGPLLSTRCRRPVEGLQAFGERALLFQPGTRHHYSSYGWIVVSAAVETAAREPFLAFMRDKVFAPLGMDDTMAESATERIPGRATFYFPRYAADPRYGLHPMRDVDYSCYAGSSIFLSTPSDLVRYGMAVNAGRLLQPATVQLLQASQRLPSGEETGYGLGWDLETVTIAGHQELTVGHDGEALGGPVVSLMTLPRRGLVIAVASNISYANTFAIASSVAQAFAEEHVPARN